MNETQKLLLLLDYEKAVVKEFHRSNTYTRARLYKMRCDAAKEILGRELTTEEKKALGE